VSAGELPITEVRVKLTGDPHSRVRAFCSVTIADRFVIRDVKIIEGGRGAFIAMPSRKLTDKCDRCHHKNHLRAAYCNQCGTRLDPDRAGRDAAGRVRLHADLAHPINSSCRIDLHRAVLQAYDEEVERSKQDGYVPPSFDDLDGGDDLYDEQYVVELQRRHVERERQRSIGTDEGMAFEGA
jgi:stage V sporulation protein G